MNHRLLEIIKYKTGGRQTDFAALLGWTPPYLAKLIRGKNFGIKPVIAIITMFPEINARWFLTGEEEMIEPSKYVDMRKMMLESMLAVLDVEKFMPVMSPEELHHYEQIVKGDKKPDFSPELHEKWQGLLQLRDKEINTKFQDAMHKSDKICRRKKMKK